LLLIWYIAYINTDVCAPLRTAKSPWPCGSHGQFAFGIDRGFVTEGKAHGHKSSDRGYRSFPWTSMSKRPLAVGGRPAVPSVYIAAEPGRVAGSAEFVPFKLCGFCIE
jgi:hypothetical protein